MARMQQSSVHNCQTVCMDFCGVKPCLQLFSVLNYLPFTKRQLLVACHFSFYTRPLLQISFFFCMRGRFYEREILSMLWSTNPGPIWISSALVHALQTNLYQFIIPETEQTADCILTTISCFTYYFVKPSKSTFTNTSDRLQP